MDIIFQSPWVLIWVSTMVWLVAAIIRVTIPEKKHWWHMAAAVVIFAAAFGVDYFVQTDREKIDSLIDRGIEATVAADVEAVGAIIGGNYCDRVHKSKADFMDTCREYFRRPGVESIKRSYYEVTITETWAVVDMNAVVHLVGGNSEVPMIQMIPVKLKIECQKNGEKDWAVSSADLVEVNGTAVNWNHI